ncbi:hypothetical protein AGMMS49992_17110 [Clostridia bacterium]|nr:hypothetical protein AGMMS49992_17110 [Clostridia bacterium]
MRNHKPPTESCGTATEETDTYDANHYYYENYKSISCPKDGFTPDTYNNLLNLITCVKGTHEPPTVRLDCAAGNRCAGYADGDGNQQSTSPLAVGISSVTCIFWYIK